MVERTCFEEGWEPCTACLSNNRASYVDHESRYIQLIHSYLVSSSIFSSIIISPLLFFFFFFFFYFSEFLSFESSFFFFLNTQFVSSANRSPFRLASYVFLKWPIIFDYSFLSSTTVCPRHALYTYGPRLSIHHSS